MPQRGERVGVRRASSPTRSAILERMKARTIAAGSFSGACLPALGEHYLQRMVELFSLIDRPLAEAELLHFKQSLFQTLEDGFAQSPHARFVLAYGPAQSAERGVDCTLSILTPSLDEQYQDWLAGPAGVEPFGKRADARVMALAEALSASTPRAAVLDIGAGNGRNAVPLARLGLNVDALEPVGELAGALRDAAAREALPISVLEQDLLTDGVSLPDQRYHLIVLSEVLPHFSAQELKRVLALLAPALAPEGRLLFNAFLADKGYTPDALAIQAAPGMWSTFYTRTELAELTSEAGFTLVSEESCVGYERTHLPAEAWPPTPWYLNWATGHNLFAHSAGHAPIALFWLEYRSGRDGSA